MFGVLNYKQRVIDYSLAGIVASDPPIIEIGTDTNLKSHYEEGTSL